MQILAEDRVLCDYNNGTVKIFDKLPYGLYLEEGNDVDTRVMNKSNFETWCADRVLSLDRVHAKEILNSCGLSQSRSTRDRMNIALTYCCLSLRDFYWVREDDAKWDEVNLFENHLSNVFVDVALRGKSATINNAFLLAADGSTFGTAPKAWVRENGLYLYKGDINDSVTREVEASSILKDLGFDVLEYTYGEWNGPVAKSKCYTRKSIASVTAREYSDNNDLKELADVNYHAMNLADYLVGNTDRHWENWGFLLNKNGLLGYLPLMDFNHAFESTCQTPCLPAMTVYQNHITQLEAAVEALQYIKIKPADLSKYKYGNYVRQKLTELDSQHKTTTKTI